MIPLHHVAVGVPVKIVEIDAGRDLQGQLKHMGFLKGACIKVIQNTKGPLIIAKGNLRLALGRGMSHKVFVEELQGRKVA